MNLMQDEDLKEDKIKKLSVIIDNIIKKLDVISYENKKDLIEIYNSPFSSK